MKTLCESGKGLNESEVARRLKISCAAVINFLKYFIPFSLSLSRLQLKE
jgi:hypothetical protein